MKTPGDLWRKLVFEYDQLKRDNENIYLAYNFITTAWNMLDWIFDGERHNSEKTELKNNNTILLICEHIANGAKHFHLRNSNLQSVDEIKKDRYVEEGYWGEDYSESPILIELNEKHHNEFGKTININTLAELVMHFWESELKSRELI